MPNNKKDKQTYKSTTTLSGRITDMLDSQKMLEEVGEVSEGTIYKDAYNNREYTYTDGKWIGDDGKEATEENISDVEAAEIIANEKTNKEANQDSFTQEMYNEYKDNPSRSIEGVRDDMFRTNKLESENESLEDGSVYKDTVTGEEYVYHQGDWYGADGSRAKSGAYSKQITPEEAEAPKIDLASAPSPVDNATVKEDGALSRAVKGVGAMFDNKNEDIVDSPDGQQMFKDLDRIGKQQLSLDAIRSVEYLANAMNAMNQPLSEPYVAPNVQFTPTESQSDRSLAELRRNVASNEARSRNMLLQRGGIEYLPAVHANAMAQFQQGKAQIGAQELNRINADATRYDQAVNAAEVARANVHNQNIQKAMQENQALGQEYTYNVENFFRTATDMNRQRGELAYARGLANGPRPYEDFTNYNMYKYADLAEPTKTKKTDTDN